jgi:hypothetical protein
MNISHANEMTKFLIRSGSKFIKFYYNTPGNTNYFKNLRKKFN